MSYIQVKWLGPIEELRMDLSKDINLIIGPQASGKSTLGKIIYFCKKIRDYTLDFLEDDQQILGTAKNELYISFLKYIRKKYMDSFGTTRHFSHDFLINYEYDNGEVMTICLDEKGYAKFKFSDELERKLKELIFSAYRLYKNNQQDKSDDIYGYVTQKQQMKKVAVQHFREVAAKIFEPYDVVYIPAGRSLLSVLSDQLDVVDTSVLDLPMKDFVDRIRRTKKRFGTKLDMVVADYVKMVKGQIRNADVEMAHKLIKSILKADYVNDTDGEKLYVDEKHWVKLIYGSSGQQEALWIVLLLFIIVLENEKSYIIIEEPEAHLYPMAQRKMVELIALTMNSSGSQIFVTTHSPYIMTSANLLIHSGNVENRIKTSPEDCVIARQLRISPKKVAAYKFNEDDIFKLDSIWDHDTGMMRSSEIDTISDVIYDDSERLIDLEIKYGL